MMSCPTNQVKSMIKTANNGVFSGLPIAMLVRDMCDGAVLFKILLQMPIPYLLVEILVTN